MLSLPYHIELDRLQEEAKGDTKLELLLKELGLLIWDKVVCVGIRIADLLVRDIFRERLSVILAGENRLLRDCNDSTVLTLMIF